MWEDNIFWKSRDHALRRRTLQRESQFIILPQNVKMHTTPSTHLKE